MPNSLGAKPSIDTSQFKQSITEMNRELRVLESGFRASAAALGDWANDATGLESRMKSLNSQIEIQRQKVALTRAEYERIAKEKGETSKAAQDLEIKLNKETETLGKMESELRETEGALNEMQSESAQAGESVEELGDNTEETSGKMDTFKGALKSIGLIAAGVVAAFVAVAGAIGAVFTGIGKLVFSAAESAAELVDLSAKTEISTTRLQELSYIGDQVGTSLDTITTAQARLIRSMNTARDGTGDQAEAFKTLGISVTDANGDLRDSEQVFSDLIDALGKVENPAERDALSMSILGKNAQEINPLISAGSDELARLAEEAHNVGAVMDEDAVAGLEAFDDTMSSLKAGVKGTLGSLAAEFLPAFTTIADALKDLFSSEEFKQNIETFAGLIRDFVEGFVDVLQKLLSGDYEGALGDIFGVENASQIIDFFTTVGDFIQNVLIPFVTTHAEEIKAAFAGIGAALAVTGVVAGITAIVSALNPVTLIIVAIIALVGVLAAAWTGNWGGIRDSLTQVWEGTIKPALDQLIAWLTVNIPLALQTLSQFWMNTLLPAIQVVWSWLSTNLFPLLSALAELLSAGLGLAVQVISAYWQNILLPALQTVWSWMSANLFPLLAALGELIGTVLNLALTALAGLWQNILLPGMQAVWSFIQKNIMPIFVKLGEAIGEKLQPVLSEVSGLFDRLKGTFSGISTNIQKLIKWIKDLTEELKNVKLPAWLTPGSPTPWEIGLVGINKEMEALNRQIPVLANNLNMRPNGFGSSAFGEGSVQNNEQIDIFGNVIIQGATPIGSLGASLKGRKF